MSRRDAIIMSVVATVMNVFGGVFIGGDLLRAKPEAWCIAFAVVEAAFLGIIFSITLLAKEG